MGVPPDLTEGALGVGSLAYAAMASVRAAGLMRITVEMTAVSKRLAAAPKNVLTAAVSRRPAICSVAVMA